VPLTGGRRAPRRRYRLGRARTTRTAPSDPPTRSPGRSRSRASPAIAAATRRVLRDEQCKSAVRRLRTHRPDQPPTSHRPATVQLENTKTWVETRDVLKPPFQRPSSGNIFLLFYTYNLIRPYPRLSKYLIENVRRNAFFGMGWVVMVVRLYDYRPKHAKR